MSKYIFIICDGLGDLPIPQLDNKTPLEAASTPNLDRLAKNGKLGLMYVLGKGVRPNSGEAHLTLFGYDLEKDYPGRGPIEAAGAGIELQEGDVAIRANLATVDKNLVVIDRRMGRVESTADFVRDLGGMEIDGVKFLVKPTTGYRVVLVMRGKARLDRRPLRREASQARQGLSDKISNSDVKYVSEAEVVRHYEGSKVNVVRALDEASEAKFTAGVLQKFLEKSHAILESNPLNIEREKKGELRGNYLLTRGPGEYRKMPSFAEKYNLQACCIAGAGLYKGLGALMGMDLINVPGATGLPNTDVEAKISAAKEQIKNYDFVFVHIKPTDIFGENGDWQSKKDFIEKIDMAIDSLEDYGAMICVTADHATPCIIKDHSANPVPLLINRPGEPGNGIEKFGEAFCAKGSLGIIEGKDLMKLLLRQ